MFAIRLILRSSARLKLLRQYYALRGSKSIKKLCQRIVPKSFDKKLCQKILIDFEIFAVL
uniref:Uncharacterized protein n=1 Tax=Siphoviridae sp. ctgFB34 TaxID=2823591 RepID=A0A8S5L7Q1_9CAUD|nr:MAG TPA: hypothetical protein [Siphoviridae sp. ctgFB34]